MRTAIVDRIEGEKVVLFFKNLKIIENCSKFPLELKEGDFVDLDTFQIQKFITQKRKTKVQNLLSEVFTK